MRCHAVFLCAGLASAFLASALAAPTTISALDARVQYDGRTVRTNETVDFDWVGVGARLRVDGASWVTAQFRTQPGKRGTRFRVYASDQGFGRYPMATVWVAPSPFGLLGLDARYLAVQHRGTAVQHRRHEFRVLLHGR